MTEGTPLPTRDSVVLCGTAHSAQHSSALALPKRDLAPPQACSTPPPPPPPYRPSGWNAIKRASSTSSPDCIHSSIKDSLNRSHRHASSSHHYARSHPSASSRNRAYVSNHSGSDRHRKRPRYGDRSETSRHSGRGGKDDCRHGRSHCVHARRRFSHVSSYSSRSSSSSSSSSSSRSRDESSLSHHARSHRRRREDRRGADDSHNRPHEQTKSPQSAFSSSSVRTGIAHDTHVAATAAASVSPAASKEGRSTRHYSSRSFRTHTTPKNKHDSRPATGTLAGAIREASGSVPSAQVRVNVHHSDAATTVTTSPGPPSHRSSAVQPTLDEASSTASDASLPLSSRALNHATLSDVDAPSACASGSDVPSRDGNDGQTSDDLLVSSTSSDARRDASRAVRPTTPPPPPPPPPLRTLADEEKRYSMWLHGGVDSAATPTTAATRQEKAFASTMTQWGDVRPGLPFFIFTDKAALLRCRANGAARSTCALLLPPPPPPLCATAHGEGAPCATTMTAASAQTDTAMEGTVRAACHDHVEQEDRVHGVDSNATSYSCAEAARNVARRVTSESAADDGAVAMAATKEGTEEDTDANRKDDSGNTERGTGGNTGELEMDACDRGSSVAAQRAILAHDDDTADRLAAVMTSMQHTFDAHFEHGKVHHKPPWYLCACTEDNYEHPCYVNWLDGVAIRPLAEQLRLSRERVAAHHAHTEQARDGRSSS